MQIRTIQSFLNAQESNLVDRRFLKAAQRVAASPVDSAVAFGGARLDTAVRGIGQKRLSVLASRNISDVMSFVTASPAAIAGAFASIPDASTRQTETAIVLNLHASMCAAFGRHVSAKTPVATVDFATVREVVKDAKAAQYAALGTRADARFSADGVGVLKGVGKSIERLLVDAKLKTVADLANASSTHIYEALKAFEPGGTPIDAAGAVVDIAIALRRAASSFVKPKKPVIPIVQQVSAEALARGGMSVRPGKVEIAYDRYGPIPHDFAALTMRYSFDGKSFAALERAARKGLATKFTFEVPRGATQVEIYFVPAPSNGDDVDSNGGFGKNFVLKVR